MVYTYLSSYADVCMCNSSAENANSFAQVADLIELLRRLNFAYRNIIYQIRVGLIVYYGGSIFKSVLFNVCNLQNKFV